MAGTRENFYDQLKRYMKSWWTNSIEASVREIWWVLFSCPDAPPGPGSLYCGKATGRPAAPLLWKSAKLIGRGSWGSGAKPKHMKKRRGKYPSRLRHICSEWTKAHEKLRFIRYFPCVFACSDKNWTSGVIILDESHTTIEPYFWSQTTAPYFSPVFWIFS